MVGYATPGRSIVCSAIISLRLSETCATTSSQPNLLATVQAMERANGKFQQVLDRSHPCITVSVVLHSTALFVFPLPGGQDR
jgi:hypothetical protein